MKQPSLFHIHGIMAASGVMPNELHPAPSRMTSGNSRHWWQRWRCAWFVWTGQADVLVWKNTDLERKIWGHIWEPTAAEPLAKSEEDHQG